ncbi:MAG: hypothetical protein EPO21_16550 [Chloroflexota bacterium]|nr:MAG: hypothetical protein EPO21_16550 [Chloroflexota bacterium]
MTDVEWRPLMSHEKQSELYSAYWSELDNAHENGRPVVWCMGMAPQEIFRAVDAVILFCDNFGATLAMAGISQELCEVAETKGFTMELCSYARGHIGAQLTGRNPQGKPLRKPDMIVYPSSRCTIYDGWAKVFKDMYPDVRLVSIDVPALNDGMSEDEQDGAHAYVKRQLLEIIELIDNRWGHRFDYDRLAEMVGNTGAAGRGLLAMHQTMRMVPAPVSTIDMFFNLFPLFSLRGRPEPALYYAEAKAEIDQRIAEGFAAVPQEKFRLYWDGVAIWTRLPEQFRQIARHRAVLVSSVYSNGNAENSARCDAARPLDSLVDTMLWSFTNLGLQGKTELISRLVTDFHADGIIMQVSRSCKPYFVGERMFIKKVAERTGVPYVEVPGDMADPRMYSWQEIEDRIEAFLERLAGS